MSNSVNLGVFMYFVLLNDIGKSFCYNFPEFGTANFEAYLAKIETGFLFQSGQLAKRPTSSTINFEVYLYSIQSNLDSQSCKLRQISFSLRLLVFLISARSIYSFQSCGVLLNTFCQFWVKMTILYAYNRSLLCKK